MAAPELHAATLLSERASLTSAQARTFVCHRFRVPADAVALRLCFAFAPARVGQHNVLLTLSLFDPHRFRGAGHRHAPQQEIVIGPQGATPGFLEGPLPAGGWTAEVDCHCVLDGPAGGVKYALDVEVVTSDDAAAAWRVPVAAYLAAGKETMAAPVEGTGTPAPIPEYEPAPPVGAGVVERGGARRWLKGDLHIHTQHSDGRWSMDDVVRYVERNRLDFLATTDHNTISAYDDVRWALERTGLPTVVIPAMELTTFWGHANALGITEWVDWRVRGRDGLPRTVGDGEGAPQTSTMEGAAAEVHRRGATFVVNHPRSAGYPACTGCRWELGDASAQYADAIEVWNGAWDRPQNHLGLALWNRWLNAGHRLPATAGTDSHKWPDRPDQQGYTWVWAQPEVEDILAAVRDGRSFLSCGPSLTWERHDLGSGTLDVWVADLHEPAEARLVHRGEVVAREPVGGAGRIAFRLDQAPEVGDWYRVEAWRPGSRMLLAMTNPRYVD